MVLCRTMHLEPLDFAADPARSVIVVTSFLAATCMGAVAFGPAIVFHVVVAVLTWVTDRQPDHATLVGLIMIAMTPPAVVQTILSRRDISWPMFTLLIIPAVVTVPLGVLLLLALDPKPIARAVGFVVVVTALVRCFQEVRLIDMRRRKKREVAAVAARACRMSPPLSSSAAGGHAIGQKDGNVSRWSGASTGGDGVVDGGVCTGVLVHAENGVGDGDGDGGGDGDSGTSADVGADADAEADVDAGSVTEPEPEPEPEAGADPATGNGDGNGADAGVGADDGALAATASASRTCGMPRTDTHTESGASDNQSVLQRVTGGGVSQREHEPPPFDQHDYSLCTLAGSATLEQKPCCVWPSRKLMGVQALTGACVGFFMGFMGIPGLPLMLLVAFVPLHKDIMRATITVTITAIKPIQVWCGGRVSLVLCDFA